MYLLLSAVILFALIVIVTQVLRLPTLNVPKTANIQDKINKLGNWMSRLYTQGKFHGVVLLATKGEVIFNKGYGFADIDNSVPLTLHSSFNLASLSKQFTASGIILLKQRGKLSYSDELREFIPELSFYSKVTIRHLLNHTSGIPDYFRIASKYINEKETISTKRLIQVYSERRPKPKFNPGEKFEYCNLGYVLLAEVIARISGLSFSTFLYEHIFHPLNMKNTKVFNLLSKEEPDNRVYGFKKKYFLFGKKILTDLNRFDGVAGDGGIYSSAYDLFLWHNALQEGVFIPIEELEKAYEPGFLNDGSQTRYGFGWFINNDGSVEHAGGWQGFATYLHRNLVEDQLIVVLDNTGNILRVTSNGVRYNAIALNLQRFLQGV